MADKIRGFTVYEYLAFNFMFQHMSLLKDFHWQCFHCNSSSHRYIQAINFIETVAQSTVSDSCEHGVNVATELSKHDTVDYIGKGNDLTSSHKLSYSSL